mgnify:CR=1 FL=1
MNIKEAKEEIKHTLLAYNRKDAAGRYTFPRLRQRPILLMGPPGIGKTAVMEQVAEECEVGLVAYVWEMRVLHLSKTFLPLILPNIANAFGVFWMTQYIGDAFPYELMESSRLDGCTDMGIFLRMVLPIVKPALFTLSIIAFLQSWNSYLLPMIMINDPKMFTIPLVIASIGNMFVADYGARILAVVVGILPIMIIFMVFSKQITEGLASGAVKG